MTALIPSLKLSDALHVISDGTYTAGTDSGGALAHSDWSYVKATTPNGVVVTGGGNLDLTGMKKVVFIGVKFVDCTVILRGCEDIIFWYCDWTFPQSHGATDQQNGLLCFLNGGTKSNRITVAGGNFHDIGNDAIGLNSCDNFRVLGTTIEITGVLPNHADGMQTTGGCNGVEVGFCDITGNLQIGGEFGAMTGINFHDYWIRGSQTGNSTVFGHYGPYATIAGVIANIYDWASSHRLDYHATAYPPTDLTSYAAMSRPQWVNVTESNVQRTTPPPGTVSPAVVWQGLNPYSAHTTFTTGAAAGPFTPVLKQATDATGASLSNLAGATVSGPIYVITSPENGIVSVSFLIDGQPVRVESTAPFSLGGDTGAGALIPFDTSGLLAGNHTLTAAVQFTDATTQTLSAVFTIPSGVGGGLPTLQLAPVDYNGGQNRSTGAQDEPATVGFHSGRHIGIAQLANTLATMAMTSGVAVAVQTGGVWPPRPLVAPFVVWVGDNTDPPGSINGDFRV